MESGDINLRHDIAAYIGGRARKGFIWGENDCALFANDMLVKFFGMEDIGAGFRGRYNSAMSAMRIFLELGYESVPDIAYKHGRSVNSPDVGDIAIDPSKSALGICMGVYSWFLRPDNSMIKFETAECDIRRPLCRS